MISRRLLPNRVYPAAILNEFIGSNKRAAEMPRGRDDDSVRGISDCRQRHGLEQNFQRIWLDLKVRGPFELFGPAPKRHVQANDFSFHEAVDFFQNDYWNDDGVFALLGLLQDSACAVPQAAFTV